MHVVDTAPGWQVVYRGTDPLQLGLLEGMLEAHGLETQRLGRADAASLGVGESAIMQLVRVRAVDVDEARRLIETFEGGGPWADTDATLDFQLDPPDPSSPLPQGPPSEARGVTAELKRLRLVSAGAALVLPGLGLLAVGARWTGLALLVWSTGVVLHPAYGSNTLALTFALVVPRVIDLVASQHLLRRHEGRVRSVMARELPFAVLLVAGLHLVLLALAG